MPTQKTGPDSLGIYHTVANRYANLYDQEQSLGGYAAVNQLHNWPAVITGGLSPSPLGPLKIEYVSGSSVHTRNSIGKIYSIATDTFAYQAPGESSYGTGQVVAAGDYGYLAALTDTAAFVRIKHESTGTIGAYSNPLSLNFFSAFNNVLGGIDLTHAQRVAGRVTHRAIMFKNHGTAQITNLKVWQTAGNYSATAIAKEAPVSGAVQALASETSVPAGLSWNTGTTAGAGLDIGTLNTTEEYGVWVRRTVAAAATAGEKFTITINYSYTVSGTSYTQSWTGHFRMPDTALQLYRLFKGSDAAPDFGAAPATTSATLPFTNALAPPPSGVRNYNYTVRYQDEYGLNSQNTYYRTVQINSAGTDTSTGIALSTPYDFSVTETRGGKLLVRAKYAHNSDAVPATYFDIYEVANETALAVPGNYQLLDSAGVTETVDWHSPGAFRVLSQEIGPYPTNAIVQVALKMRNGSGTESALTSTITTTVTTGRAKRGRNMSAFLALAHKKEITLEFDNGFLVNTNVDVPNSIKWVQGNGFTKLMEGSNVVLAFIYNSEYTEYNGLWTRMAYEQASISGAGTPSPTEVQSWTGPSKIINLLVHDTRRLKVDYTGGFFSCASIETSVEDSLIKRYTDITPVKEFDWHTLVQVFDPAMNEYETVASLDDNGVLLLRGGVNVVLADADIPVIYS